MTGLKLLALVAVGVLSLLFARDAQGGDGPEKAAAGKKGFIDRVYKDDSGKEAKYVLFVPESYDPATPVPCILFLHGAGETGTDGKLQAKVGLGPAVRKRMSNFPAIVVFPQSQKRTWKAGSSDAQRALAILDQTEKEYRIDSKRVYLSGLSMGGYGTWSLAAAHPDRWAAIVPVCGGGNPKDAAVLKTLPCWCFHGDKDNAVPVAKSRQMVAALKEAGATVKYDEYPGVGHNSWDRAYGTDELYTWLFQQHRS